MEKIPNADRRFTDFLHFFYRMVTITAIRQIFASTSRMNNKFGWGPYRMHRKNNHFIGTEPSVVKYHVVFFYSCDNSWFRYPIKSLHNHMVCKARAIFSQLEEKFIKTYLLKWWWKRTKFTPGALVDIVEVSLCKHF